MKSGMIRLTCILGLLSCGCGGEPSGKSMAGDPIPPDDYKPSKEDYAVSCKGWTAGAETLSLIEQNLVIVVDKQHALPANYVPSDLVNLSELVPTVPAGLKLRAEAATQFKQLVDTARSEAQIKNYTLLSSHRDFNTQCATFSYWVKSEIANGLGQVDAIAKAKTYSALPGTSEHQLGLAMDVTTTALGRNVFNSNVDFIRDSKEGKWLYENAWRFGFVISYPNNFSGCTGYQYESWHYRYVGVEVAKMWNEQFAKYIPYEFLRGVDCKGQALEGRPNGGEGYQLPVDGKNELDEPKDIAADQCAALSIPDVSTCKDSWLLNCTQKRWDYCALGCFVAAQGEADWCTSPFTKDSKLDPVAMCKRFATTKFPSGINSCADGLSSASGFAGWLLVCAARDGKSDAPPEWRFCVNGCQVAASGSPDDCKAN